MIQALIFDFDGLILDTETTDLQSWREIYPEYGCTLPMSAWAVGLGSSDLFDPYEYLESQLGRSVDREAIRAKKRRRETELIEAQPVLPGVKKYVTDAKRLGLKLGVASSSQRSWVIGHLSRLELLSHFHFIKCADDVKRTKPDPDLYLSALDTLGLQANQAIALEDSPNGVLAAKRAGLFCVAVPNPVTCQLSLQQADLRLTSLAELPLERLLLAVQKSATSPTSALMHKRLEQRRTKR